MLALVIKYFRPVLMIVGEIVCEIALEAIEAWWSS